MCRKPTSSHTTSATWSDTRSPRNTPIALHAGSSSTRLYRALARGTRFSKSPLLWHFNFRGPDVDRLVKGRERIYLDRFWNELSANPKAIDEATRRHYAKIYARPGAMHAAFNQFAAFSQDASDNKAFASKGKLTMPILALGAEKSFGAQQAAIMREVGTNVEGGIIANSGHWIMEEQPDATVKAIRDFLEKK